MSYTVGCKFILHPNATAKDSLSHFFGVYDNLSLGGNMDYRCDVECKIKILDSTVWEKHVIQFFNKYLPGNEQNFDFTRILINFPFMLEWVIQNKPKTPYTTIFENTNYYDDIRGYYKKFPYSGYNTKYIATCVSKQKNKQYYYDNYPNFPWNDIDKRDEILQYPKIDDYVIFSEFTEQNDTYDTKYINILLNSSYNDYKNPPPFAQFPDHIAYWHKKKKFDLWKYVSYSPLVSWEFIKANRKLPWNWDIVFRSPRFSAEFFMKPENESEAWDGQILSGFRNLTFELIDYLYQKNYKLDWSIICWCDFKQEKEKFTT